MFKTEEALVLTDEEERLLRSFRRFKILCKKAGEVFRWQTAPLNHELLIATSEAAAHIRDPQDVSA